MPKVLAAFTGFSTTVRQQGPICALSATQNVTVGLSGIYLLQNPHI